MNAQFSISKGNDNTGCSSPECRSLVKNLGEEVNLRNQNEAQLNPFWDYPNERYNFIRSYHHENSVDQTNLIFQITYYRNPEHKTNIYKNERQKSRHGKQHNDGMNEMDGINAYGNAGILYRKTYQEHIYIFMYIILVIQLL